MTSFCKLINDKLVCGLHIGGKPTKPIKGPDNTNGEGGAKAPGEPVGDTVGGGAGGGGATDTTAGAGVPGGDEAKPGEHLCYPGYRVLAEKSKYGAFCELVEGLPTGPEEHSCPPGSIVLLTPTKDGSFCHAATADAGAPAGDEAKPGEHLCYPGYRVLAEKSKYGAFCELVEGLPNGPEEHSCPPGTIVLVTPTKDGSFCYLQPEPPAPQPQ